jgi:hypothetical protein
MGATKTSPAVETNQEVVDGLWNRDRKKRKPAAQRTLLDELLICLHFLYLPVSGNTLPHEFFGAEAWVEYGRRLLIEFEAQARVKKKGEGKRALYRKGIRWLDLARIVVAYYPSREFPRPEDRPERPARGAAALTEARDRLGAKDLVRFADDFAAVWRAKRPDLPILTENPKEWQTTEWEDIGCSFHTYLRKGTDSPPSSLAYNAIRCEALNPAWHKYLGFVREGWKTAKTTRDVVVAMLLACETSCMQDNSPWKGPTSSEEHVLTLSLKNLTARDWLDFPDWMFRSGDETA